MQKQTSFQVFNASAGSGKTFTLVKEYLKILLRSTNHFLFQKILAITFTNKAAGEMKERVLKNLLEFSKQDDLKENSDMFELLVKETGLDGETIKIRARKILHNILQNYSTFHIKTIDSFTNKLIKSFAFDLGMSLDFEVELDPDSILKETIDVIISKIGIDKELTNILIEFAIQKTLEDKSWDISRELFEISHLLLNENHASEIQKLQKKSINDFKILERKLKQKQKESEKILHEIGRKGLELIDGLNLDHKDFLRSQFPKFFQNLIQDLTKINFGEDTSLYKNIDGLNFYAKSKSEDIKEKIDSLVSPLIELYRESEKLFSSYLLNNLLLKNLIPLAIINSINKVLNEIKSDNNIRLNAEFNQIISQHLREQPAPFIYEKIGEKFKHYFIDEMQDTSVLQWENLIPLIENVLSEENSSLLLVGDAKQAIYRWRGGRAEQFIDLSSEGNSISNNPFHVNKKLENLETNFRSYSEIINFNNNFFTHISKYFQKKAYQNLYKIGNDQNINRKKGGYVQLKFIKECKNVEEKNEIFPAKVYEIVLGLEKEFDRNEICVLVRKKDQGIAIAKYLTDNGIDIISSETLLIRNNAKVNFIINLLRFLKAKDNDDAKYDLLDFLYHHLKMDIDKHLFINELVHLDLNDLFKTLENYHVVYKPQNFYKSPFYESIEDIIRSFKLTKESDAYLQFFLDFVFEYSQRKSQNNIEFLDYWGQKEGKLSIEASNNSNAVQIMTIHKSKGLEFPVVIFPYDLDIYYQRMPKAWYDNLDKEEFNNFESILVNSPSSIEKINEFGKKIHDMQQEELELDNFNILYVTLTRAKEQMYIISENKKLKDKLKFYSHFFIDYLQDTGLWEEGKMIYEFGDKKRLSLKETKILNTEIQKEFISTSLEDHQINIAARSALLWDTERGDAIKFGNLIHEMMAKINSELDVKKTINKFITRGLLAKNEQNKIEKIILEIINHQLLKPYFQQDNIVFNEREILTEDKLILIPDRLIFDNNKVTIIDYKTGKPEIKHRHQIEKYALVLQKMNFDVYEKLLVYIDDEIEVIKVVA